MGLQMTPDSSGGIWSAIKSSLGLFNDTNKADGVTENSNYPLRDEYESSLDEKETMVLIAQWKRDYNVYYTDIDKGVKISFDYWVGNHRDPYSQSPYSPGTGKDSSVTDNRLFQAIETFLPVATRANPEPLVQADPSDLGQQMAKDIKVSLTHEADTQQLRRKLAKMTRHWMLNRIGVLKVSWNVITKKIETSVIHPKKMIFDREGFIDEKGFFVGEYLGEKKKASAELLSEMFPKKEKEITKKCKGKMATKFEYIEWWYRGKDIIYTVDELMLGKYKNPNWNYDIQGTEGSEAIIDPETGVEVSPAEEAIDEIEATNHLDEPSAPYRFLAIFSTGEQPHDNTSLILQNIPQQDKINRREVQIDRNVEGMNNGIVVSGKSFTEEQAAQVAGAMRRGTAIRVPDGDVQKAVLFPARPPLPADVFHSLDDARSELNNIFGTTGLTSEGVKSQETVRGKIMVNQADSSRIGGGITEYIEQVADSIYNLWVQFMFVYYDEEHFVTDSGATSGNELITLKNDKFPLLKTLSVTVKEGSLIPKDPLTQRNEAIDLWSANAIDPLSLYKKLDFPNPQEATNQLILWQMLQKGQIQPQMYLQSFTVAGMQPGQLPMQQPGTGGPAVSPIGASQPGGITPQEPAPDQSKQLIQSQPLPKA